MRVPRLLRARAKKRVTTVKAESSDKPTTFHATSGSTQAERAPERRFEYGEHEWPNMPIVIGFRPNQERS